MCGRYSFGSPDDLAARIEQANLVIDEIRAGRQGTIHYNVGPGRYGPVYRQDAHANERTEHAENDSGDSGEHSEPQQKADKYPLIVEYMRWGLVPSFAKEPRIGSTFNCRDDSLAQNKSLWQGVKQRNRCLVLAEGYYEWKKHSEKDKVPYFIKRKDGKLMCLAGLWDRNTKVNPDYEMYTYTVITTDAHKGISWLHDRMPVILDPDTQSEEIAQWLDPKKKWCSEFQNMLKPFDSERLEIYQVSPDVGKLSNDYKGLTQPVKNTLNSFFAKGKRKGEQGAEKKDVKKLKKDPEQPDDNQKTEPEEQKDQSKDDPKPSKEDDVKKKANEDTPKKKMSPRKAKPPPSKNTTLTSFFTKK